MRTELMEAYLYLFFLKCKSNRESRNVLQNATDALINEFTDEEWREVQKIRDDQIITMMTEVAK